MNSDGHYLVVISVAKYSDHHYNLPQISLPGSDLHYSFFTVKLHFDNWALTSEGDGFSLSRQDRTVVS